MRLLTWALVALLIPLAGCQGPGRACDPCAQAEATPIGAGSSAAAAASGGQRANQAPFADDTARLAPQTTIGRGEGPTTASSADKETREVASGGAPQNLGVVIPTGADASAGGGTPLAVSEAAKTVASLRASLQCALADPTCPTDKIQFISAALTEAQESLAAAQSAATVHKTVNYNFQDSRNTQVGLSTSKTGNQPALDPDTAAQLSEAAGRVVEAGSVEYVKEDPSTPTAPDAPEGPEQPLEPESPVEGPVE